MEQKGKTALITGATSGIGLELARLFAKDRYCLVLVARDEFTLNLVADEMRTLGAPTVKVIARDLSMDGAAEAVYLDTLQAGITVDVLVNDAGIGQRGKFAEIPIEKDMEIIHLNIVSLVTLTKLYLGDMLERNDGKILQLASVSSYQPTPLLAVYAATKAFVLSLTDSIAWELHDTNVHITALIPGPTDTDFFNKADMEDTRAANEHPEDPAVVAKVGYEALMRGKTHAIAPGVKRQIALSSILPNSTVANLAEKQMEKEGKKRGNKEDH